MRAPDFLRHLLVSATGNAISHLNAPALPTSRLPEPEAGAAIVHLHARNPVDHPQQTPGGSEPFLKAIRQPSDCLGNITTGPYLWATCIDQCITGGPVA
uniref:3-keto-5-aminohexanoate cleavage protein n=1 Tax=Caballeronia sp. LjRoot34 TaxID=3342325 RepID=UPI003F50BC53